MEVIPDGPFRKHQRIQSRIDSVNPKTGVGSSLVKLRTMSDNRSRSEYQGGLKFLPTLYTRRYTIPPLPFTFITTCDHYRRGHVLRLKNPDRSLGINDKIKEETVDSVLQSQDTQILGSKFCPLHDTLSSLFPNNKIVCLGRKIRGEPRNTTRSKPILSTLSVRSSTEEVW